MSTEEKIPIACPRCQQQFSVPKPPIEVSNNLRTSLIIMVHPKLFYCPNAKCHTPFTYVFAPQYQVGIGVQPVNDEAVKEVEGTSIVKPAIQLVH